MQIDATGKRGASSSCHRAQRIDPKSLATSGIPAEWREMYPLVAPSTQCDEDHTLMVSGVLVLESKLT
jgi:hypothetical protein